MTEVQIRELKKEDLFNGFLTSLDSLRKASDISKEKAEEIFKKIDFNEDYIIAVDVADSKIVDSATLLIEQKFIHRGGLVGHIEDVVNKNFQGKKNREKIIQYLLEFSKNRGCYKTILDGSYDVKPFYERLGFEHNVNALRYDHVR